MKRLVVAASVVAILTFGLVVPGAHAGVSHQTGPTATTVPTATAVPTPTIVGPPVQGAKKNIVLSVDTVQGSGGTPKAAVGCSQTNLFRQGQVVVFRMWGINVKAGGVALTDKNVKSATVNIPGTDPIPMVYGTHSTVSFWTAPWKTSTSTPIGVVNFTITVVTKANKKAKLKSMRATYSQAGFSANSQLTITP